MSRAAVKKLGDEIGYGYMMQLAEELWAEIAPGAQHTVGTCGALLVPCVCVHTGPAECDWCCGVGRVTHRVRKTIDDNMKVS